MANLDRSKQLGGIPPYTSADPMVCFVYLLLRDHLHGGAVEDMVMDAAKPLISHMTNPYLAQYAENVVERLAGETEAPTGVLSLGPVAEDESGVRVFRELTDEDAEAVGDALEIARRIAEGYETYGGVDTAKTVKGLIALLEKHDKEVPL